MMSPVGMKMLTEMHIAEIQRPIEHQRYVEKADYQGPWITLPLALAALVLAAVLSSGWIA